MIKLYMYAVTLDATDGSIQGMLVAGILPTPLEHEQATSLACQQIRESYPFADWIVTSFELSDITDDALGWVRTAYRTADEVTLQERNEELGEEIEERDRNAPTGDVPDRWDALNEQVHKLTNRVDGHDKSIETLEVDADAFDEALDAMRERIDALTTQASGLATWTGESFAKIDDRLDKLDKFTKHLGEHSDCHTTQIEELFRRIKNLSEFTNTLDRDIDEVDDRTAQIKRLISDIAMMKTHIETNAKSLTELDTRLIDVEDGLEKHKMCEMYSKHGYVP